MAEGEEEVRTLLDLLVHSGGGVAGALLVFLFCWFKSTNTDEAEGANRRMREAPMEGHFTCFAGTKVQIMTQKALAGACGRPQRGIRSGCASSQQRLGGCGGATSRHFFCTLVPLKRQYLYFCTFGCPVCARSLYMYIYI